LYSFFDFQKKRLAVIRLISMKKVTKKANVQVVSKGAREEPAFKQRFRND
jgi:hypothetical protein